MIYLSLFKSGDIVYFIRYIRRRILLQFHLLHDLRSNAFSSLELLLCHTQTCTFSILSELLFSRRIFCVDCRMCSPNWLDRKEAIHTLQWNALSFRYQEENERNRNEHHGCEEEVDATPRWSHVEEHLWCKARYDEVPKPVIGRC